MGFIIVGLLIITGLYPFVHIFSHAVPNKETWIITYFLTGGVAIFLYWIIIIIPGKYPPRKP